MNLPIAAPSANRSNYISATSAEHVATCFNNTVPIINGGSSQIGLESTIISLSYKDEPITLLRHGAITTDQLQEALDEEILDHSSTSSATPFSPGQMKKHYSPKTCLLYTSPSPRDATLSRMPSSA